MKVVGNEFVREVKEVIARLDVFLSALRAEFSRYSRLAIKTSLVGTIFFVAHRGR